MRVKIFTTGGSLDKGYSTRESAFLVGEPQIGQLLEEANVSFEYDIESVFRKDSLEITAEDRDAIFRLVEKEPCSHVLITHGTDTMPETGRLLSSIQGKTIILTGAMQPASFRHSDAQFNIGFASAALLTLPHGIYLAMNGAIFDPHEVRKNTTLDRFEVG